MADLTFQQKGQPFGMIQPRDIGIGEFAERAGHAEQAEVMKLIKGGSMPWPSTTA